jgi:hypothetical protein
MAFVNATKDNEYGVMPSAELLAAMGSYKKFSKAGITVGMRRPASNISRKARALFCG